MTPIEVSFEVIILTPKIHDRCITDMCIMECLLYSSPDIASTLCTKHLNKYLLKLISTYGAVLVKHGITMLIYMNTIFLESIRTMFYYFRDRTSTKEMQYPKSQEE